MAETQEPCPKTDPGGGGFPDSGPVSPRAEIDTSAPFESVKEAATRFGGFGYWKPSLPKLPPSLEYEMEEPDIIKLEEQEAQLEKDLILKERETLDVLKELEKTKKVVEELKSKLQQEATEVNGTLEINKDEEVSKVESNESQKENHRSLQDPMMGSLSPCSTSSAGLILMELGQAKLNLCRTTSGLAGIRASVESLTRKLEKERASLEKTTERLSLNSSKISSLEKDLNQTRLELQVAKDAEAKSSSESDNPIDISKELQRLSSEAEHFKKVGEAARSEVSRAVFEIGQTKTRIKTAEMRLLAARKMKEAARAAEAVALAEFKALSKSESLSGVPLQSLESVTLSSIEYSSLVCKAEDANQFHKKRVEDAMLKVDEANSSKMEVLKKVEAATEEVKTSRKVLEEAVHRVEAANRGKLGVEEALRKWRSEHGQKRRSIHNSTKFKNSYPSHHRRDSRMLDVNGLNLITDEPKPAIKPTLSIGEILSRKLLLPEDFETEMLGEKGTAKQKVSLGQMLKKRNANCPSRKTEIESSQKQLPGKRKRFGFARFSLLRAKETKKKKKPTFNFK